LVASSQIGCCVVTAIVGDFTIVNTKLVSDAVVHGKIAFALSFMVIGKLLEISVGLGVYIGANILL
jgi:hypothetical protein